MTNMAVCASEVSVVFHNFFCRPFSFQKVRNGGNNFSTPFKLPGSSLQFRNSGTAAQSVHNLQPSNPPDTCTVAGRWPHINKANIGGTTVTVRPQAHREGGERGRTGDSVMSKKEKSAGNCIFQTNSTNDTMNEFFSSEPAPTNHFASNSRGSVSDSFAGPVTRTSCRVGQPPSSCPSVTPGNNTSPPIAMVAPVVSSTAQTAATE